MYSHDGRRTCVQRLAGGSKTLNGANVALSKAGNFVTVEEALVTTPDIGATNGVVHVVDSVLLPPASR